MPDDFLDGLAFGEFIDKLVQLANPRSLRLAFSTHIGHTAAKGVVKIRCVLAFPVLQMCCAWLCEFTAQRLQVAGS